MTAGTLDIALEQGADWSLTLTWKDGSGNPVDLTAYTARLQIRGTYADLDSTVLLALTTSTGGITLGGAAGTVALSATNVQTQALAFQAPARYDLELVAPDGTVTRLLMGRVVLSREVTRT